MSDQSRASVAATGRRLGSELQPIRPQTRDTAVLERLARHIAATNIAPGDRLPAERDLAQQLHVGRSTIREALKRWEALGVVEMRQGSGTYLRTPVAPGSVHVPLTLAPLAESLLQTLEVRRALEGEAAAICARRASATEIAGIAAMLDRMEAVHFRFHSAPEEDWDFHQSVYRATGNPIFEQIIASMRDVFHRFWENPLDMPDFAGRTFPYHRVMYEAIARRDPEGARAAALRIIDLVEEDIREAGRGR